MTLAGRFAHPEGPPRMLGEAVPHLPRVENNMKVLCMIGGRTVAGYICLRVRAATWGPRAYTIYDRPSYIRHQISWTIMTGQSPQKYHPSTAQKYAITKSFRAVNVALFFGKCRHSCSVMEFHDDLFESI